MTTRENALSKPVVSISAYRRKKIRDATIAARKQDEIPDRDVTYYLMMAIKALKSAQRNQ